VSARLRLVSISFTGDVSDYVVGDQFDSAHRDNGRPCGAWTVEAVIVDGQVASGQISDGQLSRQRTRLNRWTLAEGARLVSSP
jgi:hypothetical protein